MITLRTLALLGMSLVLGACAVQTPQSMPLSQPWPSSDMSALTEWEHMKLPGKQSTAFSHMRQDGRDAMMATANSSASLMRQKVRIEPNELRKLQFSWKVPALIAEADMAQRDLDDSPVRIMLAFEGDRSRMSMRDRMMSEMVELLTGEPMPYATLMYVWCNHREPGSVIINPRTDRIRKLVVESGARRLNQWLDYERDVHADYTRTFGEEPGALIGIAIMTDTDNTRSSAKAWYGPVHMDRPMVFGRLPGY